jgi:hypothetical protein
MADLPSHLCTRGKTLSQSGHSFDDLILDTGELETQLIKFIEVTQKDKTQKLRTEETRMERQELLLLNSLF